MARMASSAAYLPLYTLDLARRFWAPLLCVYAVAYLLHDLMIRGSAMVGMRSDVAGPLVVSLALLVTLTGFILMFHMLRPGLPVLDQELFDRTVRARGGDVEAAKRTSFGEHERRVVEAVAMAILPFLIFYSAWGLISEEMRRYFTEVGNQGGVSAFVYAGNIDPFGWPLAIALAAWVIRFGVERLYDRTRSKWLGIVTAVFESVWIFFALFSIAALIQQGQEWLSGRTVSMRLDLGLHDSLAWLGDLVSLPLPAAFAVIMAILAQSWEVLKDGLVEPMLWLTIAAVVFGAEVDKTETLFRRESRIGRAVRTLSGLPRFFQQIGRLAGKDYHEKYTPFLNALRFILSASPVFYLSFCLYYGILELGFGWLERGIYVALGPEAWFDWWWFRLPVIDFVVNALHELLRICLLAATFELILRRQGARSVGRRARAAAE